MTDYFDILERRRSIRVFAPRKVEPAKRDRLIEAALRAPSSRGREPWEFVVVEDAALLEKLGSAKQHGSAFLNGAPLAVVIAADPSRCDVWIEDAAIAAILIQLAATALDLGSCWAQIRLRDHDGEGKSANDYLVELLGLPEGFQVDSIIGIGYAGEEKPGHSLDSLSWDKVHREAFGRSWS